LQRVIKETLDANVRSFIGNVIPTRETNLNTDIVSPSMSSGLLNTTLSAVIPARETGLPAEATKGEGWGSQSRTFKYNSYIAHPVCHPELDSGSSNINPTQTEFVIPTRETGLPADVSIEALAKLEATKGVGWGSRSFKIIGQFLTTYIIAQSETNLIIIDQHAAHERIIYDNITKNFETKSGIKLMFPEIINLNNLELEQIKLAQEFLANQGINIEVFGKSQLAIKSSPAGIQNQSLKELIFEILEFIREFENLDQELFRKKLNDKIHAQIACKSAVKAGDILTETQMQEIVNNLYKTENLLTCPHGRPTTWILNKDFIEKQFKRKL
jgi:DNA mismatch repair ATPase MutL